MKLVDEDGFEYDEDLFGTVRAVKEYEEYWKKNREQVLRAIKDNML